MGSPFNIAELRIDGPFVPSEVIEASGLQDVHAISSDGKQLALSRLVNYNDGPFVEIMILDSSAQTVRRSPVLKGAAKKMTWIDSKLQIQLWNYQAGDFVFDM